MTLYNRILAFDTALSGCSAAFVDISKNLSFAESATMERGQSEELMPMVVRVMEKSGCAFTNLDLIAVTTGPGGFTGVRIGLSAARALGLALGIPVAGFPTTDVIAEQYLNQQEADDLAVVIDTRRDDFYIQRYGVEESALQLMTGAEIAATLPPVGITLIGDSVSRLQKNITPPPGWIFPGGFALPDPFVLAHIAAQQADGGVIPPPEPVYLRGADVSYPKTPPRPAPCAAVE